ncbi:DNAse I-like superfamily protein isoform 2 [Hibiscus syriacus]|uniref:non-specific serine/threonine protein kinase n=1 Tax=Hibiscus syriacus TaxID=106335 RepID=A0A6A2XKT4_HIBSY|nr:DNAse I-like superfamily protein isoform 2 [Hibiscus syriacus]
MLSGRPTRSPCLPGDLQEIACAMHVPTRWASETIRPRPSESIRRQPSEGRSPGVHGDLQGRPEGMATYVLGACAMQHVHSHVYSLCLSKGRSPGVHGDLQGRLECMTTYGQHCVHPPTTPETLRASEIIKGRKRRDDKQENKETINCFSPFLLLIFGYTAMKQSSKHQPEDEDDISSDSGSEEYFECSHGRESRICVGTWNVGGKVPPNDLDIDEWIDMNDPADIYAFGLQEIVPLNAGNIFGAEDSSPVPKWENIIRETLNRIRPATTKVKCYSDPSSPSKFEPFDDLPTLEEEICLESDSDIGEEIYPLDEEPHDFDEFNIAAENKMGFLDSGVSEYYDGSKLDVPVAVEQHLQRQFSSPKRLDRLNCLRTVDDAENEEAPVSQQNAKFTRMLSGIEQNRKLTRTLSELDLESLMKRKRSSYVRIVSKQMVGIFLTIWVRRSLLRHIQNLKVSTVGVGVMGYIGNKIAVATSALFTSGYSDSGVSVEHRVFMNVSEHISIFDPYVFRLLLMRWNSFWVSDDFIDEGYDSGDDFRSSIQNGMHPEVNMKNVLTGKEWGYIFALLCLNTKCHSASGAEWRTANMSNQLYATARVSPLSITYYRYYLENESYSVRLHFAEIEITNSTRYGRLGRRIFNIYIRDQLVEEDFNIEAEAVGILTPLTKHYNANVTNGELEIRFYWDGKSTQAIPVRGVHGPLISGILVDPNFRPKHEEKKTKTFPIVIGVVGSVLIFLASGILFWRYYFKARARENKISRDWICGFGPVYKGQLADGTIIAVKQLPSKSRNQLLLVYEYLENNSLSRALFGPENSRINLDWHTRQKICVGIARGLVFLHEETRLKIVLETSQEPLLEAWNKVSFDELNPFVNEGDEVASVAYRYRRWKLDNDMQLDARCEIQSVVDVNNQMSFLTLNALNEFDPKYSGVDWRQKLETQRGAALATELKNNANKLAK